jgi:pimeloyl-ACP methyl ester carboxylesterase
MHQQEAAIAGARPTSVFARINGLKLHYLDWSTKLGTNAASHKPNSAAITILLCHGGSAHCHWWDDVAPRLAEHARVLALDFRGHGRSEWAIPAVPLEKKRTDDSARSESRGYGLATYLDDVTKLIRDHLHRRVVLVGHSMSGEIAMRVAADQPQLLDGLVIVDASPAGLPLKTRLIWRWKRRNLSSVRPVFPNKQALIARFRLSPPGHNLTPAALAELALKGAEQLPSGKWAFQLDPDTRKLSPGWRLPRCRIQDIWLPVLILRGEHSHLLSERQARRMQRMINGSRLEIIPSAYHHVPLDNPEATAVAISQFIGTLQAPT